MLDTYYATGRPLSREKAVLIQATKGQSPQQKKNKRNAEVQWY